LSEPQATTPAIADTVWTSAALPLLPMLGIDTNDKAKGTDALVRLVPHSSELAATLNSVAGFALTFVSRAASNKR
jgi:hypothetical protein